MVVNKEKFQIYRNISNTYKLQPGSPCLLVVRESCPAFEEITWVLELSIDLAYLKGNSFHIRCFLVVLREQSTIFTETLIFVLVGGDGVEPNQKLVGGGRATVSNLKLSEKVSRNRLVKRVFHFNNVLFYGRKKLK